MSFLNAEWRKLAIANYEVDSVILKKYLPYKTEIDLWNQTCYVSLVGFMFLNTRLLGIKIPFHVNFEEVNLRFYVRYKDNQEWKRGVVFIKEIVPRFALSLVANNLYKEHYATMPMKHQWETYPDYRSVAYSWKSNGAWQQFGLTADLEAVGMAPGSEAEFITEHYWGYSQHGDRRTVEYAVTHPRWEIYPVRNYEIAVDFGQCYGREWEFLNKTAPRSVMLAEGSEITVENRRFII